MDRKHLGRIPMTKIVIGTPGNTITVDGAADTGNEGLAMIRPYLAQKLGILSTKSQQITTAAGQKNIPVGTLGILGVSGYPDCNLSNVDVMIGDFPGAGDVLLGELFFKNFTFDIDYATGQGIVTCGKPAPNDWVLPVAIAGGVAALGIVVYLLIPK